MQNKKYYVISEVAGILQVPVYKLRYLEQITSELKVHRAKNRRYYTAQNIALLKTYISRTLTCSRFDQHQMIDRIDTLINKLKCLKVLLRNDVIAQNVNKNYNEA